MSDAVAACQAAFVTNPYNQPSYWACPGDNADGGETGGSDEDGDGDGDGDPWDPGSHVSYDPRSGIYEIDQAFVQSLIEGHLTQLQNDSARLVVGTGDYYQFVNVAAGDLAALLGLMSGDTLLSINGYDLGGFEDQITAYNELAEETSFYVTVARGSMPPITLHYELVN